MHRLLWLTHFHPLVETGARASISVCLREVEMTLFTENIFCNGFSSLVTNLVCHLDPSVSINDKYAGLGKREERMQSSTHLIPLLLARPWMVEYKIGAACRLQSAQLPAGLWGRTAGDIAMSLYDCGLILIAVRSTEAWQILEPSMTIPKRSMGMFITYLSVSLPKNIPPFSISDGPYREYQKISFHPVIG